MPSAHHPMAVRTDPLRQLDRAARYRRRRGLGFVVVRGDQVLFESWDCGLRNLLEAAASLRAARLRGAVLSDRVVGVAALLLAHWAGICAVHAEVASEAALREASTRGVLLRADRQVPAILNRRRDGPCPFEAAAEEALRSGAEAEEVVALLGRLLGRGGTAGEGTAHGQAGEVTVQTLAGSAAGLALSLVLPWLFHAVGLGPVFLPMHLPVLVTGALFGTGSGLAVGLLAPLLSTLLTGSPPTAPPVAQLMTAELATYGAAAGWLRGRLLATPHPASARRASRLLLLEYAWLVGTLLLGRLALAVAAGLLGPALGLRVPAAVYVQAAIWTGLPGVSVQLVVVPFLVRRLAHYLNPIPGRREKHETLDPA